jgi:hypothetical protein
MDRVNDMRNIPAAACYGCGGWTRFGGMSQHGYAVKPVDGRTGCRCQARNVRNAIDKALRDQHDVNVIDQRDQMVLNDNFHYSVTEATVRG